MSQVSNHGLWWWQVAMIGIKDEVTPAVLVVTVSVLMLAIVWYKMTLGRSSSPALPPGPLSLPIVGYLPFLGPDLHKQLAYMSRTYGPIFKFYLGNKLQIVINTPELAKEVLRDQDDVFGNRGLTIASSLLSNGGHDLVFSKLTSDWRKLRKILVMELLSNKHLEACRSVRMEEVRKAVRNVFSKSGTPFDISNIAFLTEANVLRRMVCEDEGEEDGSYQGDELQTISTKIIDYVGQHNLSDILPILAWFDLQGIERGMKEQTRKLDIILTTMIENRIKSNTKLLQNGIANRRQTDFLQVLLEFRGKNEKTSLSITQIRFLLKDVMIAGTETTTTLIEWVMTEVMKNENVIKRIHEELDEVVGETNIVEESHLSKLQYLNATIKETIRLHPIIPILVPRVPSQDCIVGGYSIPKGSTVLVNVWALQQDPRFWDNPLDFNPERWLTSQATNECDYNGNNMNFIPFGSGRRLCPGILLAEKMQMFVLASLLHSFNWSLPEGVQHDVSEHFGFTLKKSKQLIAIPSQRLHDLSLYE